MIAIRNADRLRLRAPNFRYGFKGANRLSLDGVERADLNDFTRRSLYLRIFDPAVPYRVVVGDPLDFR